MKESADRVVMVSGAARGIEWPIVERVLGARLCTAILVVDI
jgi:NAD(P)-dependent dehydrogenase (short-subunit alcohol dehydrogenase family)